LKMSEFLFAYGTLQPEFAPAEILPLVSKLLPVGTGFVNGILYDLGGHPGFVLDPSKQRIAGGIFQLPEDPNFLRELDAYEEFDPAEPESSPFIRILHPVVLATGGTLQCWVYIYNQDPVSARILSDGIFRKNR